MWKTEYRLALSGGARLVPKMLPFALTGALLLSACGNRDIRISFTFASEERLRAVTGVFDSHVTVYGAAEVHDSDVFTPKECTIYLLPLGQYPSEKCYLTVLLHEERHCREGNFHPIWYEEPACEQGE